MNTRNVHQFFFRNRILKYLQPKNFVCDFHSRFCICKNKILTACPTCVCVSVLFSDRFFFVAAVVMACMVITLNSDDRNCYCNKFQKKNKLFCPRLKLNKCNTKSEYFIRFVFLLCVWLPGFINYIFFIILYKVCMIFLRFVFFYIKNIRKVSKFPKSLDFIHSFAMCVFISVLFCVFILSVKPISLPLFFHVLSRLFFLSMRML